MKPFSSAPLLDQLEEANRSLQLLEQRLQTAREALMQEFRLLRSAQTASRVRS